MLLDGYFSLVFVVKLCFLKKPKINDKEALNGRLKNVLTDGRCPKFGSTFGLLKKNVKRLIAQPQPLFIYVLFSSQFHVINGINETI